MDVWTGYAILVVSRRGERKVIAGPHTHLLEYDETLQRLELSTGTPKTDEKLYPTVYLRVLHNKVSDRIDAETRDLCQVHLHLSYRVNFEGDENKWFNVENYVKFLTDHLRSRIRGAVKQQGIEAFYGNAAAIVRDVVLGAQGEDGKRTGRFFEENGMRVYDVEVLDVTIGDGDIANLLVGAQQEAVRQALAIAAEQRKVTFVRESESTKQQIMELSAATRLKESGLQMAEVAEKLRLTLAQAGAEAEARKEKQAAQLAEQVALGAIHSADLGRRKATADLDIEVVAARAGAEAAGAGGGGASARGEGGGGVAGAGERTASIQRQGAGGAGGGEHGSARDPRRGERGRRARAAPGGDAARGRAVEEGGERGAEAAPGDDLTSSGGVVVRRRAPVPRLLGVGRAGSLPGRSPWRCPSRSASMISGSSARRSSNTSTRPA